jgi:hypothetical protein
MSCVPGLILALPYVPLIERVTYEKEAGHHVHAGAEAGEEDDFVPRDHPLAAGLRKQSSAFQFEMFLPACPRIFLRIETTYFFPGPQAIVLLVFALIVGDAVLTEYPAACCQCRFGCALPAVGRSSCRGVGVAQ